VLNSSTVAFILIISTIEKRYELNSSLTGLISASYDISFCILALFVSFFGERGHKPRWLAFSAFMLGLGSLIFSLPHFRELNLKQYQLARWESEGRCLALCLSDTCQIPGTRSVNFTCSASGVSSLSNYLYVFILGQLMLGVGGTPLYTLGTTFIDDSVAKHKSSLYIGIGYAMSLLGPAVGYVLGGQLLNIYIDIEIPESTKMDPDDPRWLGAWWIGFLVCFVATWPLIIPFSCFPKYLPGKHLTIMDYIRRVLFYFWPRPSNGSMILSAKFFFLQQYVILVKNPVLMSLIVASTSEALVATGFATFLPKLIENQFGKTSSFSATLAGILSRYSEIVFLYFLACPVRLSHQGCRSNHCLIVTISYSFFLTGMLHNLTAPCNANCGCSRSIYYPVCGRDEVQYFSPCFAGCASLVINKMKKVLHSIMTANMVSVSGKCPTQCKLLPLFLTFFFFTVVFTFMAVTPTTVAILSSYMLLCFLGTIPGPILFGVAIDSSCTLWDINDCNTKGACWVYDNERMAYLLMGISKWLLHIKYMYSVIDILTWTAT
uniref:Uncharacterized protein n=1 Tax=Melopsittacus undulatus TaxID=13146 RepID=A0A8V5H5A5_MELUD